MLSNFALNERLIVLTVDLRFVCLQCRSYKNGFVWHDLCEDDLILPAHGNEYVLKGSELFDESNAGIVYLVDRIINFEPLDC